MVHAFFDPAQAADFNAAAFKRDSHFEVRYFGIHFPINIARVMLAASNANFTLFDPDDWAAEKTNTPFGVLPILKETTSDGKVLQIAESDAIERYIAKKFGFYGDSFFEETVINTFVSNTNELQTKIFGLFAMKDAEHRADLKKKLVSGAVANWIKYNELHLQNNGANGHYLGNKLTLADFKAAQMVEIINGIIGQGLVSEMLTPAILKVKSEVDKIPSLAAWRATDEFKALAEKNFSRLGY